MILQGVQGPIVTIFVNDLNIFTPAGNGIMKQVKKKLAATFNIIDIRPLAFYVRLKITCNYEQKTIKLSQPSYIKKLLNQYGILKAKIVKIFMQEISLLPYKKPVTLIEKIKYVAKIRFIIYIMIKTCINITFAISMVNYLTKTPRSDHFSTINQILRYLAGSQDRGIIFDGKSEFQLVEYLDSD